jgi:1-pyrroline-5-carboxylate dehydrogenase
MANAMYRVPDPANEPTLGYLPGSVERGELKAELARQAARVVEVPMIIAGEEVESGDIGECVMPHDHGHVICRYHRGAREHFERAIRAAMDARAVWHSLCWEARAAVFLKAADLLSTRFRQVLNAATMLGQSKTVYQAEIDAACELVDFFRFNAWYMQRIFEEQPAISPPGTWNATEARPLDGFVFAISPFNFTSIAGNLPSAPAMMGNTVVWKPASTAVLNAHFLMRLWTEAGLPPGVVNMVPGPGSTAGPIVLASPDLAGVHFTGSTSTFRSIWRAVGENVSRYRSYPRIVGETGGKDFVFVHSSAHPDEVVAATLRGAFEYQGQKCSAASRMYVPDDLWPAIRARLLDEVATIRMGDVTDFTNLMGAVIDSRSFERIRGYVERARRSPDVEILAGGGSDASRGWFVEPTVLEARDPRYESMVEEIFGPVLTVHVYPASRYEEALALCDATSPYGLTGAVFARQRTAVETACRALRFAAGNFYVNDKPTGAVVGQQPFGGSRASGTNDKAGSVMNMLRWTSVRTIKENFRPPRDYRYPHMTEA